MRIYKNTSLLLFIVTIILMVACTPKYQADISKISTNKGTCVYQPDSVSIAQSYVIPQWFKDAKLGIFIHWGVYAVPAYGSEWYALSMYDKNSDAHKWHVEKFGPVDEFGYKDFIPSFKAEKFNATEWAKLFKESGAKYVVPVAEHHDGFSMYNSVFNPWNSVKMGPKIDVIGELKEAVKNEGLYFGVSSHRAENAWFYRNGMDVPSDVQDTTISLYGERIAPPSDIGISVETGENPGSNEKSRMEWLTQTYELIDQYQPDLIWFDWTVGKKPFQPTFYKFLAYYYNNALDWNKEVVVNTKVGFGDNIQVFDIERGKSSNIRKLPWQTDTSIGKKSWGYNPEEENKTPDHIIDDFVDIVSKNGNLLLNVGPKADGTITDEQQHVLLELGKWLNVNGEAIYGSIPWVRAGEGENKGTAGYMTDSKASNYFAGDIRFTVKDNYLYAISLAWTDEEILIRSLSKDKCENMIIESVEMLGSEEVLSWNITEEGLKVKFPKEKPTEYAHVLKIKLQGLAWGSFDLGNLIDQSSQGFAFFNHGEEPIQKEIRCLINQKTQIKKVNVPAHTKQLVYFDLPGEIGEGDLVEIFVDGQLRR